MRRFRIVQKEARVGLFWLFMPAGQDPGWGTGEQGAVITA